MTAPEDGGGTAPKVVDERVSVDLFDRLSSDPEALRDYIAKQQERDTAMRAFIRGVVISADFMAAEAEQLLSS